MGTLEVIKKFKDELSLAGKIEEISGKYIFTNEKVTIRGETAEDLLVIYETFYRGTYNYVFSKPAVVIDVGMNIGASVLFFAGNELVDKVYGFEPFVPTYDKALLNIDRNPKLKSKIVPNNFGLLDKDTEMEVDYSSETKGSASIYGVNKTGTALKINPGSEEVVVKEKIKIRNASAVLEPIINESRAQGLDVAMKLDCEESEYEILHSLEKAGLLKSINVIMLEWHNKGSKSIEDQLLRNGFKLFSFMPFHKATGLIFAINME